MPATAKKAFGGYEIRFKGRTETMEEVMGTQDLSPAEMAKRIWQHIKDNRLASK